MTTPSNPYAGLIERLRDADRGSVQRSLGSGIFGEAADAIEKLNRECNQRVNAYQIAHDQAMQNGSGLSRLTRDVEEAKEALKPFANELYYWSPAAKDTAVVAGTTLTVSDIRKAGATLTRLSRPTDLGADPAFVASQSSPSVSTKGFNRGERKEAE